MAKLCKTLNVSRSGYYYWISNAEKRERKCLEEQKLLKDIRQEYFDSDCTYGSPKIAHNLKKDKNKVAKVMSENGIKSQICKKYKATTNSKHTLPVADNLVDRNFNIKKLNTVWASDITYVGTEEGWLYVAVVMDLCNREIIGFSIEDNMKKEMVIKALERAITRRNSPTGVVHHSDRGVQYASYEYQKILTKNQFIPSMSRKGDCYDNAVVESFNGILKKELVNRKKYTTREEAILDIFDYIERRYNRKRIHSSLGYLTPVEYAKKVA